PYLGAPAPGEVWTGTGRSARGWTGELWALDQDALRAAAEGLDSVDVTSVERGGRVRLSIPEDGPRTLCATIPAEDGWAAYVDGEQVEAQVWLDTFLAVELPAGAHEVELRYIAPGLVPGAALGLIGLAGLALVNTNRYIRRKDDREKGRNP
ncbi:MAG: YfhO family protein, partial [Oscillospiraceae bacterium]